MRSRFFFRRLKKRTHGMMHTRTYRLLYRYARKAPDGNMLEVGAGHGASTIALGLGLLDSRRPYRLRTIEKCEGGSRSAFGSKDDNRRILEENLTSYGLDGIVDVVAEQLTEEAGSEPAAGLAPGPLAVILIDADGELWRDFSLFYNLAVPGAFIIIDDYPEQTVSPSEAGTSPRLRKMRKTRIYVDHFLSKGLIRPLERSRNTLFASKPDDWSGEAAFDPAEGRTLRDAVLYG